jgi:hypothetical protein
MNTFQAVRIVESEESSEEELQQAWQHLVDTSTVWYLQGSYGRTAMHMIEQGLITLNDDSRERMELAQ